MPLSSDEMYVESPHIEKAWQQFKRDHFDRIDFLKEPLIRRVFFTSYSASLSMIKVAIDSPPDIAPEELERRIQAVGRDEVDLARQAFRRNPPDIYPQ